MTFIRKLNNIDIMPLVAILKDIQNDGDSYFFEDMSDEQLQDYWIKPNFDCFVCESNGIIMGSYILGPVGDGRFSRIANASYIVSKSARGKGVGKLLGLHSIETARSLGYHAIQFMRVVSTNISAVKTWQSIGFEIIGTAPKAFNHKTLGFVDAHMMYKNLK